MPLHIRCVLSKVNSCKVMQLLTAENVENLSYILTNIQQLQLAHVLLKAELLRHI